jgi:tetratricopeptide (TPR) repeat protein
MWRRLLLAGALVAATLAIAIAILRHDRKQNAAALPDREQFLPDAQVFAMYAGSSSCRSCHAREYDAWTLSHHGLAERPIRADVDATAFDGTSHTTTQPATHAGALWQIWAVDLSGKLWPQTVERVIGESPLRQFLTAFPGGRFQALEAAYDPAKHDWFDVFGNENRQPGEWGHWTGRGMTWNAMCATCHNTRLRKNYDEAADSYHTTMAEMSVGCESCHGPMKAHIDWQAAHPGQYENSASADHTIPHFTRDQILDTCGTCHSRRSELTGDFVPGDRYTDHFVLATVDSSDAFYADGQNHEEDYELTAFSGSKMHAAGVRCVDCHDPHSGKTILPGNNLCMRCHALGMNIATGVMNAPKIDPAAHAFHKPESTGSQCINCHMPQTAYMQRHWRHDHGFTTPDPLLTKQLGIPNACNRCHTDKDADWALSAGDKWYGAKLDRPARHRAQAIASAKQGEDSGRDALKGLLTDPKETWYWKAVAVNLLGRWAGQPDVSAALVQQLHNDSPLVRASSVRALAAGGTPPPAIASAIQPLLNDGSRQVRVVVADVLAGTQAAADPASRAGCDLLRAMAQTSDEPLGQLQRAGYELARQNVTESAEHLKKAMDWDPKSAAMRREAAVLYGMMNRPEDALAAIEAACRLDPNNAEYEYLLGLACAESGQTDRTISALERAVQLDPHHARAWYNLGLARNSIGQTDAALTALSRAEANDASDPDIPYARATILLKLGRVEEARAAALRALKIRPDYRPAEELLQSS